MTISTMRVTCQDCGEVADVEVVISAPLSVATASMEAARCPKCGGAKLGLGGSYNDAPPLTTPISVRAAWWKKRGEVGISSETIWSVLTEAEYDQDDDYSVPLDPDDFRRCKQLLDLIPEWRSRLGVVASVYPSWGPMVERWGDMEKLYAEESPKDTCPKLYALMEKLIKAGERAAKKAAQAVETQV